LKDASVNAAEGLKVDCPTYQALTPTGRVEAMEKQLDTTLSAPRSEDRAAGAHDILRFTERRAEGALQFVSFTIPGVNEHSSSAQHRPEPGAEFATCSPGR